MHEFILGLRAHADAPAAFSNTVVSIVVAAGHELLLAGSRFLGDVEVSYLLIELDHVLVGLTLGHCDLVIHLVICKIWQHFWASLNNVTVVVKASTISIFFEAT